MNLKELRKEIEELQQEVKERSSKRHYNLIKLEGIRQTVEAVDKELIERFGDVLFNAEWQKIKELLNLK